MDAQPAAPSTLTIDQFRQIELKIAVVTEAKDHPNADRLLVLTLDVGGGATTQVVAGIRGAYPPADLIGTSVILVSNLAPATIRGVESRGMVLAAHGSDQLSLVTVDRPVPAGSVVR